MASDPALVSAEPCSPRRSSARGGAGAHSASWELGAQRLHTPARDWPARQSFSADTSGQPLPPASRPLLRALGKKSGQRGAGTKDPAAHGNQGHGAIPLQTPGTDAAWGRLPAHTRRVLGGLTEESPDVGRQTHALGVGS